MSNWNPWHGCVKYSEGCQNCYVYRMDEGHGRNAGEISLNSDYDLPLRTDRRGDYKLAAGETVYTCFTSDFFLENADQWRTGAWDMIRKRPELYFFFITKRIERFYECIPPDWGDGWDNVVIGCTVENARTAAVRMPIFTAAPIKHRILACEPLLSYIDLTPWLSRGIEQLVAGGESGLQARVCDYRWVLGLAEQCELAGVPFWFKQTGARLLKDGKIYNIPRRKQHEQARLAGISTAGIRK